MNQSNIILIMADHFRRDCIGASTPNLQKLAKVGVTFQNAYCTAPLCQPARVSLITGHFPDRTGVCGNQSPVIPDAMREDTYTNHLQRGGYYTAHIGKHHYIDRYGIGMDVTQDDEELRKYGYDHVYQVVDDGENMHNEDEYTKYLRKNEKYETFVKSFSSAWKCGPHPFSQEAYVDGFIGRKAVEFVENFHENKPFYLNLGFVGPHPPYWHPGELSHEPAKMWPAIDNEAEKIPHIRAHYMDKVAIIDRYIGLLMDALAQKGILENTTIIFTSDHGDCLGDYGIMDKRYFYECSAGVPLIMSGAFIPKEQRKNGARESHALISHLDLYPTILHFAGIPKNPRDGRWGKNIMEMLEDIGGSCHSEIFAQLGTAMMVRSASHKMVYDPQQGGVVALYNLLNDAKEQFNLAQVAGYESITLQLMQRMLSQKINTSQYTHIKEEQRLQKVHIV